MSRRAHFLTVTALLVGLLAPTPAAQAQAVLYVDDDAPTGGDGTSWATAYKHLQDALLSASSDPGVEAIRVAGGTYAPDQDEVGIITLGDRDATFQLLDGIAIAGGYRGLAGGGDPNDRDVAGFETTLSGNIGDPNTVDDNSYHVVTGSGTDDTAVLDGVSVAYGHVTELADFYGGAGVYVVGGSPTLRECTIRDNGASRETDIAVPYEPVTGGDGPGLYCDGGSPTLIDCLIESNSAAVGADDECGFDSPLWVAARGGDGGGLCFKNATPALLGCSILNNQSGLGGDGKRCAEVNSDGERGGDGGGAYLHGCPNAVFVDCLFSGNTTGGGGRGGDCGVFPGVEGVLGGRAGQGAGLYIRLSYTQLINCVFAENTSGDGGPGGDCQFGEPGGGGGDGGDGAAITLSGYQVELVNCLIGGNIAGDGGDGGVGDPDGSGGDAGSGAAASIAGSVSTFANCTIVQNTAGSAGTGGDSNDPNYPPGSDGYGGIVQEINGAATIANTILWGNVGAGTSEQQQLNGGTIDINYCDVDGWSGALGGVGNIGSDPGFMDPNNADYHLGSDSSCIDAGDNDAIPPDTADLDGDGNTTEPTPFDLDGLRRVVDFIVDIGAYEGQRILTPGYRHPVRRIRSIESQPAP